jgi:aminoacrylate hydrolase
VTTPFHIIRRGQGPPLLWLVGLGGRAEFWAPQFDRFVASHDCIGFDHRRDHDALPPDPRETVQAYAEDALRVLDGFGVARADIVGHSLGGAIGQHLAVHHPERVGRLVLSATWAGPTPAFLELFRLRKAVLQHCGARDYLIQGAFLGNPGPWVAANLDAVLAGVEARLAVFPDPAVEAARMDAVCAHDLRARLPEVRADTLVICARDDQITSFHLSQEVAALIPRARLHALPHGNHFAPANAPDDFAAALRGFLA